MRHYLADPDPDFRQHIILIFVWQLDTTDRTLISQNLDSSSPWIDPMEAISSDRVAKSALKFGINEENIRARYKALIPYLNLKVLD